MVMLVLIVQSRLEMAFVYSSSIHIPESRSRNSIQNSFTLIEHLANRDYIVLLAETTNIINMLLEPLETDYWLVPHPLTNFRECRQTKPSHFCDPDGLLETNSSTTHLLNELERAQPDLYSRAGPCERQTQQKLNAELMVLVLKTFPKHATRNMTEFTQIVRDVYGWDAQSQSDCASVSVLVLITDPEYRAMAYDSTTKAEASTLDFKLARSALLKADFVDAIRETLSTVKTASESQRLVDDLRNIMTNNESPDQVQAAGDSGSGNNALWFVLMAVTLFVLIVAIFIVLYCCLVRNQH